MASTTAAGTAYATWGQPMIPFFIFYSMFGFQRVGDLIWSFGDQRGRGFLLGATAGRTTLTGEGLQHCDGHSHVLATTVPNCRAYDPAFAYEVAVIIRDGIERMYGDAAEDVFYYLTLYNENYTMPAMPDGAEEGIVRGLYRYREAPTTRKHRAQILASGTAMLAALEAQEILADQHDVAADVWSATSYKLLRDDALEAERWSRLHPNETATRSVRHGVPRRGRRPDRRGHRLHEGRCPTRSVGSCPQPFVPLGTDGYGFSDTRAALRRHFEVDAAHVVIATLDALARSGDVKHEVVDEAIRSTSTSIPSDPTRGTRVDAVGVRTPGGRLRRSGAGRPRPSRRGRRRPRRATRALRRRCRRRRACVHPR